MESTINLEVHNWTGQHFLLFQSVSTRHLQNEHFEKKRKKRKKKPAFLPQVISIFYLSAIKRTVCLDFAPAVSMATNRMWRQGLTL